MNRLKIYTFRISGDYASGAIVVVAGTDKKALALANQEYDKDGSYFKVTFDRPCLKYCQISTIETGVVTSWGYAE